MAFAQRVIADARRLHAHEPLALELDETVYALDSTTLEFCLSLFPWARVGRDRGAIKMHTLLDPRGSIPANLWITTANFADVRLLDILVVEPGAIYVLDRGHIDFGRLYQLDRAHAPFVIRAHRDLSFRRLYSHPVDRSIGLICDQTIRIIGKTSTSDCPDKLRRVRFGTRRRTRPGPSRPTTSPRPP